jgi:hypothetical protein
MRLIFMFFCVCFVSDGIAQSDSFSDTAFWQEYHQAYPIFAGTTQLAIRNIAVDAAQNVWVATKSGVFVKKYKSRQFTPALSAKDNGAAYSIASNTAGEVMIGNWKGLYIVKHNLVQKIMGITAPVAAVCAAEEGFYAAGPTGVWLYDGVSLIKKDYAIARSVRKIISDKNGGLWVATDVGVYHCSRKQTQHFSDTSYLLSAYIKGLSLDKDNVLWAAGLGGISLLRNEVRERVITTAGGCSSKYMNCMATAADGTVWAGSDYGITRFAPDGSNSLLFSKRWLLDDKVNDLCFDSEGNAWVATEAGVSAIMKRQMTLAGKEDFFYDVLMKRHIREPWIAAQVHLKIAGDLSSWQPEDDDNDGEFTGNYLAMESFRYAATGDSLAKINAKKAFLFLKKLSDITGGDGYFARTIVPVSWAKRVHDGNQTYSPEQLAEELVKEPRFKPVETRWHKSADGHWLWKGDASSDEWCGHMMSYYFYYTLAADETEKKTIRDHVSKLIDHLIAHNFAMMDADGKATRWSVWSPSALNHDPEWLPDQSQNSMEILAFLKLAYHITGKEKYQENYLHLINQEHYLDNMARITAQNPAWFIYFDVTMQAYLYPIFLHCEKDPKLLAFYKQHLDNWMEKRKADHNPLINFLYCYASGKKIELAASVGFLQDTPLDLIDWHIDHTRRADITLVTTPVLDEVQVNILPPAQIRQVVRWDKNPWTAKGGSPDMEREPVFWLFPYWMGRYLKMIQ